jgi:NitT/TauT family transport system permease protein
MTAKRRLAVLLAQLATIGVILALWQTVSRALAIAVSRPGDVAHALRVWFQTPVLRGYIGVTLKETVLGLLLTFAIAIVLAVVLASIPILAELLDPFLALIAALPKLALAPVFLIVFGFGTSSKVYFIAASLWFIPFQSLYTSLTIIDESLVNNTRMLGARLHHAIWNVYIPSALGAVLTSLRVTTAFALIAAVLAELLASTSGIGFEIQQASTSLQSSFVVAGVLIIAALGLVIDRIIVIFDRRFRVRWAGK